MKKIYSFVLMAVMLLIGTTAWATTVATVTLQTESGPSMLSYETLDDALSAVNTREKITELGGLATSVVNIQLQADATLSSGVVIQSGNREANKMVLDLNGFNIAMNSYILVYVAYLELTGQGSIYLNNGNVFYVYGYSAAEIDDVSHLVIGANVKVITPNNDDWAICIFSDRPSDTTYRKYAYGVIVDIYGEVYGSITINGNVNYVSNYQPHINVYEGGSITVSDELVCIYAAGYGIWNIEGTLTGGGCIYAKAGEITLDGADLSATGAYAEPQGWGGGYNLTGDAIVYDSYKGGYAEGGMKLTVTGETTVTSENGYAIQEVATKGDSKLPDLTIESGTFEGSDDKGAILTTDGEKNKLQTEGTISGGNFVNDQNITEYLGIIEGTVVAVTDESGNTTYVVENIAPEDQSDNLLTASATDKVILNHATQTTVTLVEDKTVAYLALSGMDKVIIPSGLTLTIGNVAIGEDGQIEVQAGAKLIVNGENGVVAKHVENIVLQNEDGARSIFLFNPAVTSNRHPNATVEFITNSWYASGSSYQWERFGIPTHEALKSITCNETTAGVVYEEIAVWNDNTGWQSLGYIGGTYSIDVAQLNKPFATYNMIAYRTLGETAPKTIMTGELVGNHDATLNAPQLWNPFANSYTAEVDLAIMSEAIEDAASGMDAAIYVARPSGVAGHYNWDAVDYDNAGKAGYPAKLQPMQAFILCNQGTSAQESVIDYNDMIWTPATNPSPAPARRLASGSEMTTLYVNVMSEQGEYDKLTLRERSEVKESEKYMNDDLNIYAMGEKKCAILANDNLDNTYLGVSTVSGGNFTISFAEGEGREFDLIDMENGARVAANEGETYTFHLDANTSNDYRFKVVERKVATAMENTEAVKSAKGIYTITGQYVGEMNVWNTLPAGVYVINGAKCVK